MQDVLFVIKCLVVTAFIVIAMQIRIGHRTAEGHVMSWIHSSSVSQTLQDVAEGAVKAGQNGKDVVWNFVGANGPTEEPAPTEASTGGWFKIKRSAAYHRQKEREEQRARVKAEKQSRLNEGAEEGDFSEETIDRE